MKEETIVLTGKAYNDLKAQLKKGQEVSLGIGSEDNPRTVQVQDAYVDSDPDFTVDKESYPAIDADTEVQVRIRFKD